MNDLKAGPQKWLGQLGSLGLAKQIRLALIALALIAGTFAIYKFATKTSYETVASGVQGKETQKIIDALSDAGIESKLGPGGTSVEVPSSQTDQARLAIAASGADSGSHVGFDLFDQTKLGATDFQQQIQYQRALQGTIASNLEKMQCVNGADVQVVLPREQLFTEEGQRSQASVLLDTSCTPTQSQVQGMARYVQQAVSDLDPERLTITDQSGRLLWPAAGGAAGEGAAKQVAQMAYDQQLAARINAMLDSTLGRGKAQAQVTSDLNMDKVEREQLRYGPKRGVPLTEEKSEEQLEGTGAGAAAPAGTDSNIPTYGEGRGGQGSSTDYSNDSEKTEYGVDKTVTSTQVAPGAINRLGVALVVDRSVPAEQVDELRAAVSALAGIDQQRGDTLAVSRVAFAAEPKPEDEGFSPMNYLPAAIIGLLAVAFVAVSLIALRKRDRRDLGPLPAELEALSAAPGPPPAAQPAPAAPAADDDFERVTVNKGKAVRQVEQIIDEHPDHITQMVRNWLNG